MISQQIFFDKMISLTKLNNITNFVLLIFEIKVTLATFLFTVSHKMLNFKLINDNDNSLSLQLTLPTLTWGVFLFILLHCPLLHLERSAQDLF